MYDNKFPARILGEILRAKRCEYGVEDYPEGADLVGGGNDSTPTTQRSFFFWTKKLIFSITNWKY